MSVSVVTNTRLEAVELSGVAVVYPAPSCNSFAARLLDEERFAEGTRAVSIFAVK